ncbi:MAG TPA: glycosyltransferase [Candidatus Baltobacteraceae bacterium]|nr:glycosyltransferase [Candidatus Baltobacteraceae bacterium]
MANTSRQFEAFARKRGYPFLTICGGTENRTHADGSATRVVRRRGRVGFALDKKHDYDLAFWRHYNPAAEAVRKFDPDIVHITGPSDVGQLGALVAYRLGLPLAASWHTNLHQYAEQRSSGLLDFFPPAQRQQMGWLIRETSLKAALRFYKIPRVLFAPNPELAKMLELGTGKPVYSMGRGVETELFSPKKRDREGGRFTLGYVGRLTIEKNIRFLAELERTLLESGFTDFRFSIVGQGGEEEWLKANMRQADFAGVLHGENLARAYANMDAFVFPSNTDTFGNVVLEALASGVPAIVTDCGGPQFIVKHGETGFVAHNSSEFAPYVRHLAADAQRLQAMREAARVSALQASWDAIFEGVYAGYRRELRNCTAGGRNARVGPQATVAAAGPGE